MPYNPQAIELNEVIKSVNPHIYNLLSERGRGIFFPKKGILSQTADAQGCKINATIGSAFEDDNTIMCLQSIAKNVNLTPKDAFSYAKGPGDPGLRKKWKEMMFIKNPSLEGAAVSLPVVTSALTHGLSLMGYFFVDPEDEIILPHLFWGNYRLIFEKTWHAKLSTFQTFTDAGTFDVEALKEKLMEGEPGKRILLLNFPNNPAGYTPTTEDAQRIVDAVVEVAEAGNEIVVLADDAYFGLVYETGIMTESIFAYLANAHERILAVKLDGATKEDYVWGFRTGFATFGSKLNSEELYRALESKLAGAVRSTISNAAHVSQSLLLEAYKSPDYEHEKSEKFETLKTRYTTVKNILKEHSEYSDIFTPLPFNSGYFMCIQLNEGIDSEELRQLLINKYDTGIIVIGNLIRIAFSSTPTPLLETLYDNIYQGGKEIKG
jgi:aspartate/methionine/tyrosine aminotransferase